MEEHKEELKKQSEESTSSNLDYVEDNSVKALDGPIQTRGMRLMNDLKASMDNSRRGKFIKAFYGASILVCSWAYSLDSSTTYSLQPLATSHFSDHSMGLASLSIASAIISSVSQPVLAKLSDAVSRPFIYVVAVLFYTVGYIIVASSKTISAYIVGVALASVGKAGVSLMNSLVVADLTPLKWRGLVTGILATPFIINTWFAGLIVNDLTASNWRWGYGMFAIIIPAVLSPAIAIMFYFEGKAAIGIPNKGSPNGHEKKDFKAWSKYILKALIEVDALGLLLLGFGFALLLLPFSLYTGAENGWRNPSIIAMITVGGVLLIIFGIFEYYYAPYPAMPLRILNRTLVCSIIIDFFYYLAGYIGLLYFSSYVYIVQEWSYRDWTYFNNTLTLALCVFGVIAGVLFRITHRYKVWQLLGLAMRIIGYGIMLKGNQSTINTVALVFHPLLAGAGGGLSVVASSIALQASVPHEDVAIASSLLNLWTNVGGAIGDTITVAIWDSKMPNSLRKHLPASVNDTEVMTFYGDITSIRNYPMDSEVRQGAITAYREVNYYLYCIALGLSFLPFIAAFFQTNYFLGNQQNAVDNEWIDEKNVNIKDETEEKNRTWKKKLADYFM